MNCEASNMLILCMDNMEVGVRISRLLRDHCPPAVTIRSRTTQSAAQVALRAIVAHYGVEGGRFYSVARTWHLQIGLFWIECWQC